MQYGPEVSAIIKLAAYEFVKLWQKRMFLALSLLLLAASLLTLYLYEKQTPAFFYVHQQRESYQRFLQGEADADAAGFYQQDLDGQERYLQTYAIFVEEMADRVRQMEQVSIYADRDSYVHRNLMKTQADFASFSGSALTVDNCFGVRALAGYNGGLLSTYHLGQRRASPCRRTARLPPSFERSTWGAGDRAAPKSFVFSKYIPPWHKYRSG